MSQAKDRATVVAELPWACPQHPQAQVRHLWDQTHYVMNGYPAGTGSRSNHKYECAECGRKLAAGDKAGG